jgi:hypothetical protein
MADAATLPTQSCRHAPGVLFPIFGIPLSCLDFIFIFGRFFVDAKMRESAEYAVTNRRAIIVSGIIEKAKQG